MIWKPNVTVAAVVARDGKFLLVEEETDEGLAFNQPAGHLERGESLVAAVIRETREETAYDFQPTHLVGIYHWQHPSKDLTYLRFAFAGELRGFDPDRRLDTGIVAARWLRLRRGRRRAGTPSQSAGPALHRRPARRPALPAGKPGALRMTRAGWFCLVCVALAGAARADEAVRICHGYSCIAQADIRYGEAQLGEVRRLLLAAVDAAEERKLLGDAVGRLYGWAGEQSDIRNDRGGNYADGGIPGKMDCIDHSTSTTRLLRLLEARGDLRWHRVLDPEERN